MSRLRPVLCLLVASLAAAAGAQAQDKPVNLIATPAVKAALRAAFLKTHPQYPAARVKGPLKGRTYYGGYKGKEYALAFFDIPRFHTQDQPELFVRKTGGAWVDRGDTGGDVCPGWVPLPLIRLWTLPSSGDCYYLP